jgi:nitrite reductase/ring-hydroxylating ferredoxin subunit/uncharacterized membrane protein
MHRQIDALIDAQEAWATPLGEQVQAWLAGLFDRARPVKDFLNGTWLGHPLHPVVTDVPVGAMTVSAALDLTGHDRAADLAMAVGIAGMAASVPAGAADAVDVVGRPRLLATVHAVLMTGSLLAYLASLGLRLISSRPGGVRSVARLLGWAGYGALSAGAYVGGDLVYRAGNQVDRHAWRRLKGGWQPLDVAEIPEGVHLKAMLGKEPLGVLREGGSISAIHAVCSHQGGPLDKGALVDGCVECPWHQSRFRMADGHVVQGPAVYDQPAYEVRPAAAGGYEARLRSSAS